MNASSEKKDGRQASAFLATERGFEALLEEGEFASLIQMLVCAMEKLLLPTSATSVFAKLVLPVPGLP